MWKTVLLVFMFVTTNSFLPPKSVQFERSIKKTLFSFSTTSDSGDSINSPSSSFDSSFAEAMSKPLPDWYLEAKAEKEKLMMEIEKNREQIVREFREKYEVSEDKKLQERREKWEQIQRRIDDKAKQKNSWLTKAQLLLPKPIENKSSTPQISKEDDEPSTQQNWEAFLAEEEAQTGISLPNIFDVFPELRFRWPKWARRKDGSVLECNTDSDCPVPLTCCAHPIVPGPKFCCSGWGQRMLVKSYIPLEVRASGPNNENQREEDGSYHGGAGRDGTEFYHRC